jgi:hypothetical protein
MVGRVPTAGYRAAHRDNDGDVGGKLIDAMKGDMSSHLGEYPRNHHVMDVLISSTDTLCTKVLCNIMPRFRHSTNSVFPYI